MKISKILQKSIFYALMLLIGLPIRAMDVVLKTSAPVPVSPKPSEQLITKATVKKKKKKKRSRKKKKAAKAPIVAPKPIIFTLETSHSTSKDGSYLKQITTNFIEIADPKNDTIIRLYTSAPIKEASPEWEKRFPLTIKGQEDGLKSQLLKKYNNMSPTHRVSIWFDDPFQELMDREFTVWENAYYKHNNATGLQRLIAANKALKEYYGLTNQEQIYIQKRPLTNQEKWTIVSHNFAQEVDKHIPEYAVYSQFQKGDAPQASFVIPGELQYLHEGIKYKRPVAFTYTLDKRNNLYHRFANKYPKDNRVEKLLSNAWNLLNPGSMIT